MDQLRRTFLSTVGTAGTITIAGCNQRLSSGSKNSADNRLKQDNTDRLNSEQYISPGATIGEIESALSSPGKVVFDSGNHILSDIIRSQAPSVEVVIGPDAHLKISDDAVPTRITDNTGNDRTPLFHITHNNFHIRNHGTLDANNSTHPNGHVALIDTVNRGSIDSRSGTILDTHDSIFAFDSTALAVTNLYYKDSTEGRPAVVVLEGCDNCVIDNISAVDTGEAIDLNGVNQNIQISNIRGKNLTDQVLDINGSQDIQVQNIQSLGTCHRIILISGTSGPRFSEKSGFGSSSSITIDGVSGVSSGIAIHGSNVEEINDVSISGIDISSTSDHAVRFRGYKDAILDGLYLQGKAKSHNGHAWYLGGYRGGTGGKQTGARLNIEGTSQTDNGVRLVDFNEVLGQIYAHDCGSSGIVVTNGDATSKNGNISILAQNNGHHGISIQGDSTKVTGWHIFGTSTGNIDEDVSVDTNNNRFSLIYETMSNRGIGNEFV